MPGYPRHRYGEKQVLASQRRENKRRLSVSHRRCWYDCDLHRSCRLQSPERRGRYYYRERRLLGRSVEQMAHFGGLGIQIAGIFRVAANDKRHAFADINARLDQNLDLFWVIGQQPYSFYA